MISSVTSGASAALLLLAGLPSVVAQSPYSVDSRDAILQSARTLAHDLMLFYPGNQTGQIPGILPGPPDDGLGDYYWWQGGAMMGAYIDYWRFTGDSTYNDLVKAGIVHQVGENRDFQPTNHTRSLGNDDQGFWGMTAMLAAEMQFPDPEPDEPQWLALAQATWATQAHPDRHDDKCGGGMRWQVPITNAGYNYKNTIANGCFFNIGARLHRYTGNETYLRYAEETWDWMWAVNYIDHENWRVYDGGHVEFNCTDVNKATFSYNIGVLMQGAAYLANYTEDQKWLDRTTKLAERCIEDFFAEGAAFEVPCEGKQGRCTADMLMFKGFVHRWLSWVTVLVPSTRDLIRPALEKSAAAAAAQCTGGASGRVCGFYWSGGVFVDPAIDKTTGAGEAMNVLSAVSALLIDEAEPPVTNATGGTSQGDPNAGQNSVAPQEFQPLTTADRAGAGILTFLILTGAVGTWGWMAM
ncbi:family 76 glycosyl hydrolase [Plectosphaerella cucumerina]|uniref:Mannan endo-1,6-alpha-mannosidase n=1 Tax=Plectosphaerella cucumerina TaxID=40658 RepID=A0A8K0X8L9_9PEZI|nr:family 76 glycosyl hydrolase [Plectosphaerella cucumerina]